MTWLTRLVQLCAALLVSLLLFFLAGWLELAQDYTALGESRPRYTDQDIERVGIVLTYEAQVFPEPTRSQAFRAIAWSIRNRVATRYNGAAGYSDEEHLLNQYSSYSFNKFNPPNPRALEIARQVMGAVTATDDATGGARHYVDNSYWTGTHEPTGWTARYPDKHPDVDIRRMIYAGNFVFYLEWHSTPDHAKGPLYYGLYFFHSWPPPEPSPLIFPVPVAR